MYNLVRQAEVEILPMAISENIGVINYSPTEEDCYLANMLKTINQQKDD